MDRSSRSGSAGSTIRGRAGVCFLLAALCAISCLGIGASAAGAAPSAGTGWVFRTSFDGGENAFYQISTPQNPLATDSHGNILKANEQSGSMKIFTPDPFVGGVQLATYFLTGIDTPRNIAVDTGDDTIYVDASAAGGAPTIHRYISDGQPTPTYTVDPAFELPNAAGIAVDPTTHDLLVADPAAEGVRRYSSSGTLLATIPTPSMAPTFVAAAADGSLYVASSFDSPGSGVGFKIVHLEADGTVLGTISRTGLGGIDGLTWDSAHDQIVVASGGRLRSYSPTGQLLSDAPAQGSGGIGVDPDADLLYQGGGPNDANIYVYEAAVSPGVETPQLSDLTGHSVHLKAEVEPGEAEPGKAPAESKAHFEYCLATANCGAYRVADPNDPNNPWARLPDHELKAPGVAVIDGDLTGLLAHSNYLVRIVASNVKLTSTNTAPFATADISPDVVTTSATDIAEDSAVLKGTVNPNGFQTTYHFEYGLTSGYGSRVPIGIEGVVDGSRAPRILSRTINGLAPGATYHYRIVAQNAVGTSFGADRTFTTVAAGGIPQRGYEQVTPVDKHGRPLSANLGFVAKADGSALVYNNLSGTSGSPLHSYAISYRGQSDWESDVQLSVPLYSAPAQFNQINYATTLGVSEDFTKQMVATDAKLTPEGTNGWTNLYIEDIKTGSFTFVGSTEIAGDNPSIGLGSFLSNTSQDKFVGAAPDYSWVVFKSNSPLLPGASFGALYKWSKGGGLEVVSLLPDGTSSTVRVNRQQEAVIRSVSRDGSRVYFTGNGSIYLHDSSGPSKPLPVSHIAGEPDTPRAAVFLGASGDGRYAFFVSAVAEPLTDDAVGKSGNVYRYDAVTEDLEYIDAHGWSDGGTEASVAVSEDGQTAYFRTGVDGIYAWRNGTVEQAAPTDLGGNYFALVMSPGGRYLSYVESTDVYLYDADTDTRTCVSCLADGTSGKGVLPVFERKIGNLPLEILDDSGRLFFSASGRLVANDANGKQDVYMYQDGQNSLISPGTGPFNAELVEASPGGSNVFFTTNQKLVGQDNDQEPDVYDARIGGGLAAQNPPPPQQCLRDDCKATPGAGPEVPFGGSEAIKGSENVKAPARKRCGKGAHARKVKGKTRCVKSAKAKKKQKKANSNRRQGR